MIPCSTLLYQFPISHYCEKVRWALDYKKIPYRTTNLLPGPHLLTTRRLAKKTSVPILVHEGKTIQDSTHILDYLDEIFPEKSLSPSDANHKKEALELEEYFDQEIGVHLRRYFYHTLLNYPKMILPMILSSTPWYGAFAYTASFPVVRKLMKKGMNIHAESAARSAVRLDEALKRLDAQIQGHDFLVGNTFSRADITAASLLAPFCFPPQHTVQWPDSQGLPEPLASFRKEREDRPFFKWVLKMYQEARLSR